LHLSSKPSGRGNPLCLPAYFGWTFGLPPGLPGGGITGVLPVSGVGARISGSTPEGGHSTPLDLASLSPNASLPWPVVVPGEAFGPRESGFMAAQLVGRWGSGAAVSAIGVAGAGGACACTALSAAMIPEKIRMDVVFI
jgi:hypothetical protein